MTRLAVSPSAVTLPGEDGYLAFVSRTGRFHHLNPTAALILELCDGSRDQAELVRMLGPALGPSAVEAWLDSALADGILIRCDDPPQRVSASDLVEQARSLRDQGRILPAFLCQTRAAELAPEDPDICYGMGELAHILGRRADARSAFERYAGWFPDDAELAHLLISLRDERAPSRASDQCIQQLYARFASNYDQNMVDDLGYQAPDRIAETLARVLGDRRSLEVLDLGCGTGLSGLKLKPYAARLTGIDLSPAMLEKAGLLGIYDHLETAEITSWLAKSDTRFDLIVACDCLIYFGDLGQVIGPASQRLKPEGILILTAERGDSYPFLLTDSGRYTHHRDHIVESAKAQHLNLITLDDVFLRYEYGEEVHGLLAVLSAGSRDD